MGHGGGGGGADVVVVGNGAIGLSLACEIRARARDVDVVVVGPAHRTGGATHAAGAMLGCFGEVTQPTLASAPGRAKFALARAAHARWSDLLETLEEFARDGEPPLVRAHGTFVIHNARSGRLDDDNLRALLGAVDEFGAACERVDSVPGLFPAPDARPLSTYHLADEHGVEARDLLTRLERRADALGARRVDGQVNRILGDSGAATGVELVTGDRLGAGAIAVAAGAYSSPLLDTIVEPFSIQPVLAGAGFACLTTRTRGPGFTSVVRSVNRAGSCGLHVVPLGGGVEYFGATNVVYGAPVLHPHLGVVHFLIDCVIDQLDQSASYSRIVRHLAGNRPVSLDTFPLLGATGVANLWVFTGTYRDGLHASPEIASRAADLLLGGENRFDAWFEPTRRPISLSTVEQSIDEFSAQRISSTFESPTVLSQFMDHEDLADIFRPRAARVYEVLDWDEGLPTDILDHLAMNAPSSDDTLRIATYLRTLREAPDPRVIPAQQGDQ